MESAQAKTYLQSLLGRRLQITTMDGRIFVGEFKCTDNERNVILAGTLEYRRPLPSSVDGAATAAAAAAAAAATEARDGKVRAKMTSRYLGLVVVPGEHISKIEVEQVLSD